MIPKIVHYCWFGGKEKSKNVQKCIDSWRTFLPDYRLMEWNEGNCCIDVIPYVRQAYNNNKYAFVSDYFRLKALFELGGVYFDTDYEIVRPMDEILNEGSSLITGMESINNALTAFIASEPFNPTIKELMDSYLDRSFLFDNGDMDLTPINKEFSALLKKNGVDISDNRLQKLESGIIFYPINILCGFDVDNWHELVDENTVGVHHMGTSWATPQMKRHILIIHSIQTLLGYEIYDNVRKRLKNLFNKTR